VSGFGGEIWILLAEDFPSAQKLSLKNVITLSHDDVMAATFLTNSGGASFGSWPQLILLSLGVCVV
jgi:hypothetical protein